jgi:hypothetical protein
LDLSKNLWSFGSKSILPKFYSRILISESVESWEHLVFSKLEVLPFLWIVQFFPEVLAWLTFKLESSLLIFARLLWLVVFKPKDFLPSGREIKGLQE